MYDIGLRMHNRVLDIWHIYNSVSFEKQRYVDTSTEYVYIISLKTDEGSTTIYRIYKEDDSCPNGDTNAFAGEESFSWINMI